MPSTQAKTRLVVLISGSGTNLQAILDACAEPNPVLGAEVVLVISNRADAYGLQRAQSANVPTAVIPFKADDASPLSEQRAESGTQLAYEARLVGADLVVLAGWDHLLGHNLVAHHTVVNLHPAKPGAFPGLGAIERSFEAWKQGKIVSGGVMVHYVPDEGVDNGPVIDWEEVPFDDGDTLESFAQRVHLVEHRLLVRSLAQIISDPLIGQSG